MCHRVKLVVAPGIFRTPARHPRPRGFRKSLLNTIRRSPIHIAEWGTSTNKSTPRRLTGQGLASRITKRGYLGRNSPERARQTYVIRLQHTIRHRAVGLASPPRQSGAHPADLRRAASGRGRRRGRLRQQQACQCLAADAARANFRRFAICRAGSPNEIRSGFAATRPKVAVRGRDFKDRIVVGNTSRSGSSTSGGITQGRRACAGRTCRATSQHDAASRCTSASRTAGSRAASRARTRAPTGTPAGSQGSRRTCNGRGHRTRVRASRRRRAGRRQRF